MRNKIPDKLKKWCYYDVNTFSYQLKENVPDDIKDLFQKYKDTELDMFDVEK